MSTATVTIPCPACDQPLPAGRADCPHCRTPAAWVELLQAFDHALRRFEEWHKRGQLGQEQYQAILTFHEHWRTPLLRDAQEDKPLPDSIPLPQPDRCWSCEASVPVGDPACAACGAPLGTPAVQTLRFWTYLCHEIKDHETNGRLTLAQAHACMTETRERMAALTRRLEKERTPAAKAATPRAATLFAATAPAGPAAPQERRWGSGIQPPPQPAAPATPAAPRRPLWEIMLDPRNIQWLLVFGAALLVLGLVIYLYTVGFFENPATVAVLMGIGNVGLLAAGWTTLRFTRYQVAGRAVTLLACLIMPLNLWFYHVQNLVTLYDHLWVAALVCCVLYAASAWVLRDPLFVYVLVAGVTMTGLLLLADVDGAEQFWQITHPATLLVVLGLVALHAERAFPPAAEGPFTRKQFGLAFFWSGQAVLGAGLLLVLGAQLIGYFYQLDEALFQTWGIKAPSPITSEQPLQLLALCLVLAGLYAYVYSDLVVRRIGVYIYLAVFTLLWAEVLVVDLFALPNTQELAIVLLALTGLAANLAQPAVARRPEGEAAVLEDSPLVRACQPIGVFLSTLPVLLGVGLHWRALNHTATLSWAYVGAMLVTALTCRIGAHLNRHTLPKLSAWYFFGTAAATLVGAAGLLTVLGQTTWQAQAPLLMAIPILYVIAARLYRGHTPEQPLVRVGHVATLAMLVSSLAAAFRGFVQVRGEPLNLALAGFFAEAALFYGLVAAFRRQTLPIYLATAMACGAVWQLLTYGQFDDVYYTLTFALVGLVLLIGYRFAVLERFNLTGLANAVFGSANALLSLGFVAGALLTLSHLAAGHQAEKGALVGMLLTLTLVSLLAVGLVQQQDWRRWYVVTTVVECVLTVLVLAVFGNLTLGEKLEITSVVIGLALLFLGHIGWYREQERQSDLVSISLFLGSILVALPLTIATLTYRSYGTFHTPDEVGMLAAGIVLLGTGFMFQFRSTTLAGAVQLVLWILTLAIYLPWDQVSWAAIFLMVGGGSIFGIGLILSIYRDRLLALPDRIKRREGVFRVLAWR